MVAGEGTDLQVFAFDRRAFFDGLKRIRRLRKLRRRLPQVQARYRAIAAPARTRAYWEPLFRQDASVEPPHAASDGGEAANGTDATSRLPDQPRPRSVTPD